ncbi:hypothetical protein ABBQ32_003630 [Trebouxia sp. C0010 RCD-2024]
MADQSDKELAAVFDLLKISLSKADPTLDKSNALKGLVVAAVGRAQAAGELKGSNPNQIATDVCITLRHLTGGLLAAVGARRVHRAPKVSRHEGAPTQDSDNLTSNTLRATAVDSPALPTNSSVQHWQGSDLVARVPAAAQNSDLQLMAEQGYADTAGRAGESMGSTGTGMQGCPSCPGRGWLRLALQSLQESGDRSNPILGQQASRTALYRQPM